jgi:nicotinate-nucleotide adenylyltransferase
VKIGLFGGTFDPPHIGHLIVAQDALLALGLDRVLFVPAANPPHKGGVPMTAAGLRAGMLKLAIRDDVRFQMDALELERSGPSYTVDTLTELRARMPEARWTLLIGSDQYAEFATWRRPERIRELARVAVLTRHGTDGSRAPAEGVDTAERAEAVVPSVTLPGGDLRVDVTRIDVSATAIRQRVHSGVSIRYLVPPRVEEFIREQGLYSRTAAERRGSIPDHANRG